MKFIEYYFTEFADSGSGLNDFITGVMQKKYDGVTHKKQQPLETGKINDNGDDPGPGPVPPPPPPPKPRIRRYNGSGDGSFGYMIKSPDFYDMIIHNYEQGKYDDILEKKPIVKKLPHMVGREFLLKPVDQDLDPEISRSVYILKDKDVNPEWTFVAFDGKQSFKDAIRTMFKGELDNKDIKKLYNTIKWHQAPPKYIKNPKMYANWNWSNVPEEDKKFLNKFIDDLKKSSQSSNTNTNP